MKQTLENLIQFSSNDLEDPKRERICSFHYDHSGHVITTNSHVLFASKHPFEITKAGKTFSRAQYQKGQLKETGKDFPDWKIVIPEESAKKATLHIPKWFELFKNTDATFILDFSNPNTPFFKVTEKTDESCFAFNAKYLSSFADQEVSIFISGSFQPAIITSINSLIDPLSKNFREDVLNEDWFYILMPIRLDEEELQKVVL